MTRELRRVTWATIRTTLAWHHGSSAEVAVRGDGGEDISNLEFPGVHIV